MKRTSKRTILSDSFISHRLTSIDASSRLPSAYARWVQRWEMACAFSINVNPTIRIVWNIQFEWLVCWDDTKRATERDCKKNSRWGELKWLNRKRKRHPSLWPLTRFLPPSFVSPFLLRYAGRFHIYFNTPHELGYFTLLQIEII